MQNRLIGAIDGANNGVLVIATAAIHGNEPAGVKALQEVFTYLESIKDLHFQGRFVGILGNKSAYLSQQRYAAHDFNRCWQEDNLKAALLKDEALLVDEDLEMVELYRQISAEAARMPYQKIIFLDLHTTSAGGGIFCIPIDEATSLTLARSLHTPVILKLFERIQGAFLKFAAKGSFCPLANNRISWVWPLKPGNIRINVRLTDLYPPYYTPCYLQVVLQKAT